MEINTVMSNDCFSCNLPTMHQLSASSLLPGHSHGVPAGSEDLAPNATTISGSLIAVTITIRSPLYANRTRQWLNSPDGAVQIIYSNGQQLEAYASNVCNAPAFVTAGFYQVKSARELVNQVMP